MLIEEKVNHNIIGESADKGLKTAPKVDMSPSGGEWGRNLSPWLYEASPLD